MRCVQGRSRFRLPPLSLPGVALCGSLVWPTEAVAAEECKALTEAGRRPEAVEACRLEWWSSRRSAVAAERAHSYVRALMLGSGAPDADAVAVALGTAQEAHKRAPNDPEGYAAFCDVAARIGDTVMLEKYVGDLERIATKDAETTRVKGLLRAAKPSVLRSLIGAILVLVPSVVTLAHAVWRAVGRRGRLASPAVAIILWTAALAVPSIGRADDGSPEASAPAFHPGELSPSGTVGPWAIDDKNPEDSVPTPAKRDRDPLAFAYWLQDLSAKALAASNRGDHEAAVRYYRAMVGPSRIAPLEWPGFAMNTRRSVNANRPSSLVPPRWR